MGLGVGEVGDNFEQSIAAAIATKIDGAAVQFFARDFVVNLRGVVHGGAFSVVFERG